MILRGPRSVCLLVALLAAPASAQSVAVAVYGAAVSNSEVDSTRQARGLGVAADVRIDYGRFRFEARGVTASLDADFSVQPDYAMHTLEATATYRWHPLLALEAGIGRRFVSPDFTAQELGLLRIGVVSETRLSSLGAMQAHVAYLFVTGFSGGGDAGFAGELGFGISVGRPAGRLAGLLDYTYQRIDRRTGSGSVPISSSIARLGLGTRF